MINGKFKSSLLTLLFLATIPMQAMEPQPDTQALEQRKKNRNSCIASAPFLLIAALLVLDNKTTYHENTFERMLPLDSSAVYKPLIIRKPGALKDSTELVVKTNETNDCYAGFSSECITSNPNGQTCEYQLVDDNGSPMIHELCYSSKSSYVWDALTYLHQKTLGKNDAEADYGICQPEDETK